MLTTTLSIGLATHLDMHDFASVKKLIAATDEALYKAKQAGKNGLVVY
jgi:PleD family two-component response regulator